MSRDYSVISPNEKSLPRGRDHTDTHLPPLVQAMSAIFVVVILIEILESISKCLFGNICFDQNSNENIARISALKVFIASLGLPGSFLVLPVGFLINDITY